MMTVFDANIIPIVIALLVGVVVAWWIFKRSHTPGDQVPKNIPADGGSGKDIAARTVEDPAPAPTRAARRSAARVDGTEGNSIVDQGAAATADVAGEMLGIQVHGELPGADGPPDNLEMMKGVGPKFVAKLQENGIIRFDQLARLSSNEIAILDEKMGPFKGRLTRDRVTEQASHLARGDRDGFEAKFGKLGGS